MAIMTCPRCGAKNRVDPDRSQTLQPVCGRCGERLAGGEAGARDGGTSVAGGMPTEPLELTDDTFAAAMRQFRGRPVLVDCWAPWCGPCRLVAPIIDQLAAESGGRYVVAKLNTDENPNVAGRLGIEAIPTLIIFKDGEPVDRIQGAAPKHVLAARLAQFA